MWTSWRRLQSLFWKSCHLIIALIKFCEKTYLNNIFFPAIIDLLNSPNCDIKSFTKLHTKKNNKKKLLYDSPTFPFPSLVRHKFKDTLIYLFFFQPTLNLCHICFHWRNCMVGGCVLGLQEPTSNSIRNTLLWHNLSLGAPRHFSLLQQSLCNVIGCRFQPCLQVVFLLT